MGPLLVRTWNLFHGNTVPPERAAYLDEMVRLASADSPDVLCLQEVPAWALDRLSGWSGMHAFGDVAARPALGPLPVTATIGRAVTSLHHGVIRSFVAGQANAILVAPALGARDRHVCVLNPRSFRRTQARWLGLDVVTRLSWARERRICQAVRAGRGKDTLVVANLHATAYPRDPRLADAELMRAATFVDGIARPSEPIVLCGDFNISTQRSSALAELASPEWGFSRAGSGIDHVIVRGLKIVEGPERWPNQRRRLDGRLLSDHAPVEARIA